jgi:hypothetical protein
VDFDDPTIKPLYERTHLDGSSVFLRIMLPNDVSAIVGPFFHTNEEAPPHPPAPLPNIASPTIISTIDPNWALRGTAAGFPPVHPDIITIDNMHLPLTFKGAAIIDSWEHKKPNGWVALATAEKDHLAFHMANVLRQLHEASGNPPN